METKNVTTKRILSTSLRTTIAEMNKTTEPLINELYESAEKNGFEVGNLEFVYYNMEEDLSKPFDLKIALPVKNSKSTDSMDQLTPFKCLSSVYKGSMDKIEDHYKTMFGQLIKNGFTPAPEIREVYLNWESYDSEHNLVEVQLGVN